MNSLNWSNAVFVPGTSQMSLCSVLHQSQMRHEAHPAQHFTQSFHSFILFSLANDPGYTQLGLNTCLRGQLQFFSLNSCSTTCLWLAMLIMSSTKHLPEESYNLEICYYLTIFTDCVTATFSQTVKHTSYMFIC